MCAVVSCASVAYADSFTFSTLTGATAGGQPVNATAGFVTRDGFVSVVIANNQPNPKSIIQAISDLFFSLSSVFSGGTLGNNFSQERNIAADGTFTDGNVVDTGWAFSNVAGSPPGFHLNVLGTPTAPEHLIIGGPGLGSVYSNADASIAGNGPHNPFLGLSAVFNITNPLITASTQVLDVSFSFGTEDRHDVPGVLTNIPDSGSAVALLGLALMGLAAARAQFRKA
jgi:VPDSG-CTERM motif